MTIFAKRVAACAVALAFGTSATCRADEAEEARSVYSLGKAAYDRGDYQEALTRFSRAYALRPAPALLFNMAQASRLSGKGHCAEALDLYERYLQRDPAPENRTEVEERIGQMRACARDESASASARFPLEGAPIAAAPVTSSPPSHSADERAPLPPRAATPPPRPEASGSGSPPLAAVLATGLGASMALAGGILYLRARAKFDEAEAACPCPEGTYSNWETLTSVSYALMATGVVVSGTGAAFWILSGTQDSAEPRPSGAGLRLWGRF